MPQLSQRLAAPDGGVLEELMRSPSAALFAARAERTIVGVLTMVWYAVPSGRKAWIEDVVVDRTVRGVGIGEALVRAAVAYAAARGIDRVQLTSAPHREAARALYRKIGFMEAETTLFALKTDK